MIANSSYLSVFLEFMEECVRVERSCRFGHLRTWPLVFVKNRPRNSGENGAFVQTGVAVLQGDSCYRNWDALIM